MYQNNKSGPSQPDNSQSADLQSKNYETIDKFSSNQMHQFPNYIQNQNILNITMVSEPSYFDEENHVAQFKNYLFQVNPNNDNSENRSLTVFESKVYSDKSDDYTPDEESKTKSFEKKNLKENDERKNANEPQKMHKDNNKSYNLTSPQIQKPNFLHNTKYDKELAQDTQEENILSVENHNLIVPDNKINRPVSSGISSPGNLSDEKRSPKDEDCRRSHSVKERIKLYEQNIQEQKGRSHQNSPLKISRQKRGKSLSNEGENSITNLISYFNQNKDQQLKPNLPKAQISSGFNIPSRFLYKNGDFNESEKPRDSEKKEFIPNVEYTIQQEVKELKATYDSRGNTPTDKGNNNQINYSIKIDSAPNKIFDFNSNSSHSSKKNKGEFDASNEESLNTEEEFHKSSSDPLNERSKVRGLMNNQQTSDKNNEKSNLNNVQLAAANNEKSSASISNKEYSQKSLNGSSDDKQIINNVNFSSSNEINANQIQQGKYDTKISLNYNAGGFYIPKDYKESIVKGLEKDSLHSTTVEDNQNMTKENSETNPINERLSNGKELPGARKILNYKNLSLDIQLINGHWVKNDREIHAIKHENKELTQEGSPDNSLKKNDPNPQIIKMDELHNQKFILENFGQNSNKDGNNYNSHNEIMNIDEEGHQLCYLDKKSQSKKENFKEFNNLLGSQTSYECLKTPNEDAMDLRINLFIDNPSNNIHKFDDFDPEAQKNLAKSGNNLLQIPMKELKNLKFEGSLAKESTLQILDQDIIYKNSKDIYQKKDQKIVNLNNENNNNKQGILNQNYLVNKLNETSNKNNLLDFDKSVLTLENSNEQSIVKIPDMVNPFFHLNLNLNASSDNVVSDQRPTGDFQLDKKADQLLESDKIFQSEDKIKRSQVSEDKEPKNKNEEKIINNQNKFADESNHHQNNTQSEGEIKTNPEASGIIQKTMNELTLSKQIIYTKEEDLEDLVNQKQKLKKNIDTFIDLDQVDCQDQKNDEPKIQPLSQMNQNPFGLVLKSLNESYDMSERCSANFLPLICGKKQQEPERPIETSNNFRIKTINEVKEEEGPGPEEILAERCLEASQLNAEDGNYEDIQFNTTNGKAAFSQIREDPCVSAHTLDLSMTQPRSILNPQSIYLKNAMHEGIPENCSTIEKQNQRLEDDSKIQNQKNSEDVKNILDQSGISAIQEKNGRWRFKLLKEIVPTNPDDMKLVDFERILNDQSEISNIQDISHISIPVFKNIMYSKDKDYSVNTSYLSSKIETLEALQLKPITLIDQQAEKSDTGLNLQSKDQAIFSNEGLFNKFSPKDSEKGYSEIVHRKSSNSVGELNLRNSDASRSSKQITSKKSSLTILDSNNLLEFKKNSIPAESAAVDAIKAIAKLKEIMRRKGIEGFDLDHLLKTLLQDSSQVMPSLKIKSPLIRTDYKNEKDDTLALDDNLENFTTKDIELFNKLLDLSAIQPNQQIIEDDFLSMNHHSTTRNNNIGTNLQKGRVGPLEEKELFKEMEIDLVKSISFIGSNTKNFANSETQKRSIENSDIIISSPNISPVGIIGESNNKIGNISKQNDNNQNEKQEIKSESFQSIESTGEKKEEREDDPKQIELGSQITLKERNKIDSKTLMPEVKEESIEESINPDKNLANGESFNKTSEAQILRSSKSNSQKIAKQVRETEAQTDSQNSLQISAPETKILNEIRDSQNKAIQIIKLNNEDSKLRLLDNSKELINSDLLNCSNIEENLKVSDKIASNFQTFDIDFKKTSKIVAVSNQRDSTITKQIKDAIKPIFLDDNLNNNLFLNRTKSLSPKLRIKEEVDNSSLSEKGACYSEHDEEKLMKLKGCNKTENQKKRLDSDEFHTKTSLIDEESKNSNKSSDVSEKDKLVKRTNKRIKKQKINKSGQNIYPNRDSFKKWEKNNRNSLIVTHTKTESEPKILRPNNIGERSITNSDITIQATRKFSTDFECYIRQNSLDKTTNSEIQIISTRISEKIPGTILNQINDQALSKEKDIENNTKAIRENLRVLSIPHPLNRKTPRSTSKIQLNNHYCKINKIQHKKNKLSHQITNHQNSNQKNLDSPYAYSKSQKFLKFSGSNEALYCYSGNYLENKNYLDELLPEKKYNSPLQPIQNRNDNMSFIVLTSPYRQPSDLKIPNSPYYEKSNSNQILTNKKDFISEINVPPPPLPISKRIIRQTPLMNLKIKNLNGSKTLFLPKSSIHNENNNQGGCVSERLYVDLKNQSHSFFRVDSPSFLTNNIPLSSTKLPHFLNKENHYLASSPNKFSDFNNSKRNHSNTSIHGLEDLQAKNDLNKIYIQNQPMTIVDTITLEKDENKTQVPTVLGKFKFRTNKKNIIKENNRIILTKEISLLKPHYLQNSIATIDKPEINFLKNGISNFSPKKRINEEFKNKNQIDNNYEKRKELVDNIYMICSKCNESILKRGLDDHNKVCLEVSVKQLIDKMYEANPNFSKKNIENTKYTQINSLNLKIMKIISLISDKISTLQDKDLLSKVQTIINIAHSVICNNDNLEQIKATYKTLDGIQATFLKEAPYSDEILLLTLVQRLIIIIREKEDEIKNMKNDLIDLNRMQHEFSTYPKVEVRPNTAEGVIRNMANSSTEKKINVYSSKHIQSFPIKNNDNLFKPHVSIAEKINENDKIEIEPDYTVGSEFDSSGSRLTVYDGLIPHLGIENKIPNKPQKIFDPFHKEAHRSLFYAEAHRIKSNLSKNHPAKNIPISIIYDECVKMGIKQADWSTFIQNKLFKLS